MATRRPGGQYRFDGAKLRQLREAAGVTQERFGASIGKNHVAISRIEGGVVQPTLDTAARIAAVLGVSLDSLVTAAAKK